MANHEPVNTKALIFPGILAICAVVALTWFPPTISHQDAAVNPAEIPEDPQLPVQTPIPIYETEPGSLLELEDVLNPTLKTKEQTETPQNDEIDFESAPI